LRESHGYPRPTIIDAVASDAAVRRIVPVGVRQPDAPPASPASRWRYASGPFKRPACCSPRGASSGATTEPTPARYEAFAAARYAQRTLIPRSAYRPVCLLVLGLVVASAVLLSALDRGWANTSWDGKADDYAYVLAALSVVAFGYVSARRWSVLAVGAIFAVTIVVQQLTWIDDPVRSGIDDLAPIGGLILIPLPMAITAVGVGIAQLQARTEPSSQ
jgi:hypothetical protein